LKNLPTRNVKKRLFKKARENNLPSQRDAKSPVMASDESGNLTGGDEMFASRFELGRRYIGKGGDLHADEHNSAMAQQCCLLPLWRS
jgi:hypothetical protein